MWLIKLIDMLRAVTKSHPVIEMQSLNSLVKHERFCYKRQNNAVVPTSFLAQNAWFYRSLDWVPHVIQRCL